MLAPHEIRNLTDEELLTLTRVAEQLTPLEFELAWRLESLIDANTEYEAEWRARIGDAVSAAPETGA